MHELRCPLCESVQTEEVYSVGRACFASLLRHTPLCLRVHLCHSCCFVFQASAYTEEYDELSGKIYESYGVNENFDFPDRTKRNLDPAEAILRHLPRKSTPLNVLEIGSNRGDLLTLLKEEVPTANILGVEPAFFSGLTVPTVRDVFRPESFNSKFDVVIAKHVIEHTKKPREFVAGIREILSDDGILYVEVPDLDMCLRHKVEDFILDHVCHFDKDSLLATLQGFRAIEVDRTNFLRVIAVKENSSRSTTKSCLRRATVLKEKFASLRHERKEITERIIRDAECGRRIVFYGVSFYFRRVFQELRDSLNGARLAYIDDNCNEPFEASFGLQGASSLDENDLVVICSNNHEVQKAILARIGELDCGATVVSPWMGVSHLAVSDEGNHS